MTAILAVSLAFAESALAINLTISNTATTGSNTGAQNTVGQSFINDPSVTGDPILLNNWTFAFNNLTNANSARATTLSIYSGSGNGGSLLASSTSTQIVTFATFPDSVRWTFAGGVSLVDNQLYTAVIQGFTQGIRASTANPYPNGNFFLDSGAGGLSSNSSVDLVFQGNFSPTTPVPFEFDASGGLAMLGAGWLLRKRFQKKQTTK